MAFKIGLDPDNRPRRTFWIGDPAVDQVRAADAFIIATAEINGEPKPKKAKAPKALVSAVLEYYRSGATDGIPMVKGEEPPTVVTFRALTARERAKVDGAVQSVSRGADGKVAVKTDAQMRLLLAFATACDVPDLPDEIETKANGTPSRTVSKRTTDALGLDRLSDEYVDAIATAMGMEAVYHFGRLVLTVSEVTAADRFRDSDGSASGRVRAHGRSRKPRGALGVR